MKEKLIKYPLFLLTLSILFCTNRDNRRFYVVTDEVKTQLNARAKPSLNAEVVFKFKLGEKLLAADSSIVKNDEMSWREIIHNERNVWVSDSFLKPYLGKNSSYQCLPPNFKSGCLGKYCSKGNCGNEYQLYFLSDGKFKATYTCHNGSEGNWFLENGKLKAQSIETIHPEDTCDFDEGTNCIEEFKKVYGKKRIIKDSFEFDVRNNSVIATMIRKENILNSNNPSKVKFDYPREIEVFCLQVIPDSLNLKE